MAAVPRMGRARAGTPAPPRGRRAHRRPRGPDQDDPRLGTRRPPPIGTIRAAVPQARPAFGEREWSRTSPATSPDLTCLTGDDRLRAAVTLGDAGTAIDLARQIDLRAVTVTERKASLLIDVARAFFQWGKYEQAHAAL